MRCSLSWISGALAAAALAAVPPSLLAQAGDLPPAGYGTLRQDQVGVRLVTGQVMVRALPLDERVIRLLAPDAYQSLHELVQSRSAAIAAAARAAGSDSASLFMVTFFALEPRTQFSPDQIYVTSQGREFRPLAILPLTSGFAEKRIDQRQQAAAIYVFEAGIEVLRPFTVAYGDSTSDAWEQSLQLLDAERSRARSRAQQAQPSQP